jgi:hypothetical protein
MVAEGKENAERLQALLRARARLRRMIDLNWAMHGVYAFKEGSERDVFDCGRK